MGIGSRARLIVVYILTGISLVWMLAYVWAIIPVTQAQAMTDYGRLAFPGLDLIVWLGSWVFHLGIVFVVVAVIEALLEKLFRVD